MGRDTDSLRFSWQGVIAILSYYNRMGGRNFVFPMIELLGRRRTEVDDEWRIVFPSSKEQKGLIRNEGERGACKTVNHPSCGDEDIPTHLEERRVW